MNKVLTSAVAVTANSKGTFYHEHFHMDRAMLTEW